MEKAKTAPQDYGFASLLPRFFFFVNISLVVLYLAVWGMMAHENFFIRADFSSFYTGWAIVRDGRGSQLYDMRLQSQYQQRILHDRRFQYGILPYDYPPHATLPFVPLAWFSRPKAFFAWTFLQCILLAWLVSFILNFAKDWQASERRQMMLSVLAFPPLYTTFQLGAFSLLILVCTLELYRCVRSNHPWRAGLWLAAGTVKPQLMLFPAVMLFAARQWRALFSAGAAVCILMGAAFVFLGKHILTDYIAFMTALLHPDKSGGIFPYKIFTYQMYNFKGTLMIIAEHSLGYGQVNMLSYCALFAAMLYTYFIFRGTLNADEPAFEIKTAVAVLLGILFSLHLNTHDCLLLIAPVLLFYNVVRQHEKSPHVFILIISMMPLIFLFTEYVSGILFFGIRFPVIMMAVLLFFICRMLREKQTYSA